jgi:rubrerythrin
MDIYEYAMQMEKESESYYRQLAQKTDNNGLKIIFNMLGDEEAKHYAVVAAMKNSTPPEISATDILSDAREVFRQMTVDVGKFNFKAEQPEFYKKAQEIEKKSRNFYLQKADEIKNNIQKNIFINLAEEEKKHYFLLQNIIDFVSRPKTWLENAEWYHLDEF